MALSNELAHPEPSHRLSRKAPGETEVTLAPRLASVVPGRLGSLRICEGPSACRDSYPRQGNGESHAFTTPSNPTHFNFYPQELICTCLDPRENITALFLRPSLGLIQQGGPSLETVGVGGGGGVASSRCSGSPPCLGIFFWGGVQPLKKKQKKKKLECYGS